MTVILVLQELLKVEVLNYLGPIPQVMHQEDEVMLRQLILDPALAVQVEVEDLKSNQNFGVQFRLLHVNACHRGT